jgi:hypothetical protein
MARFEHELCIIGCITSEILRYQKLCLDLHKRVAGLVFSNVARHRYCAPPRLPP